jgi:hypothetical protein
MEGIGLPLGLFMSFVGTAQRVSAANAKEREALSRGEMNALSAEQAASDAIERAQLPGSRARMQGSQIVGAQRAQLGATGVDVNVGSPTQLAAQTRVFSDLDEQIIRNNSAREAYGYRSKANMFRRDAKEQAEAARTEKTTAMIGGMTNLLGIGSKWMTDLKLTGDTAKPSTPTESDGSDLSRPASDAAQDGNITKDYVMGLRDSLYSQRAVPRLSMREMMDLGKYGLEDR